jgi:hypothetical protein
MAVQEAKASFSIPSLIAIGAAIASLFVGALGGLILATIAIIFGVIGFGLSLSARTRGGVVSVFSMLLAGIGIVVAVFKALGALF